jgi:Holliday junction resolvasome RuvABC endonuclease subunit
LALDQATLSGWSVLDSEQKNDKQVVAKGLINLKDFDKPYACFRQEVIQLITKFKPDCLVYEDLRSMRNVNTVKKLQQITGIVMEICEAYSLPYYEYLTVSVRAKLCKIKTGKGGRGTKMDLAHMICDLYGWEFPVDKNGNEVVKDTHWFFNETDAIGLAIYHLRYGQTKRK